MFTKPVSNWHILILSAGPGQKQLNKMQQEILSQNQVGVDFQNRSVRTNDITRYQVLPMLFLYSHFFEVHVQKDGTSNVSSRSFTYDFAYCYRRHRCPWWRGRGASEVRRDRGERRGFRQWQVQVQHHQPHQVHDKERQKQGSCNRSPLFRHTCQQSLSAGAAGLAAHNWKGKLSLENDAGNGARIFWGQWNVKTNKGAAGLKLHRISWIAFPSRVLQSSSWNASFQQIGSEDSRFSGDKKRIGREEGERFQGQRQWRKSPTQRRVPCFLWASMVPTCFHRIRSVVIVWRHSGLSDSLISLAQPAWSKLISSVHVRTFCVCPTNFPELTWMVFVAASVNGEMTDLNMVQVSVVRSSSAQRSIVDTVGLRSSLDGDSQHRRTSSFPENMASGMNSRLFLSQICCEITKPKFTSFVGLPNIWSCNTFCLPLAGTDIGPDGKGFAHSSHSKGPGGSNSSSSSDVQNTHF